MVLYKYNIFSYFISFLFACFKDLNNPNQMKAQQFLEILEALRVKLFTNTNLFSNFYFARLFLSAIIYLLRIEIKRYCRAVTFGN